MSRVLAIGDIHTKNDILLKVSAIAHKYDKVVFIGDYVDDWGKPAISSLIALKMLMEMDKKNKGKFIFLMGNHDYTYISDKKGISSGFNYSFDRLINSGIHEEVLDFMKSFKYMYMIDGVNYSHAGITKTWDGIEYWSNDSPIWARHQEQFVTSYPQVTGHTPVETCKKLEGYDNFWCIDTFSTYPNGDSIGDGTVLEIIDGKEFNVIEL